MRGQVFKPCARCRDGDLNCHACGNQVANMFIEDARTYSIEVPR